MKQNQTILLDEDEISKLDNMFSGDKSRDASSGIRGYLFQDLVAVEYLLDEDTVYICTEYLEDIDVFCKDNIVKVMQVKYYPKTSPDRKEIMGDLYYQYLRFQVLKSKLKIKPILVIHRSVCPKNTTLKEMQDEYIGVHQIDEPDEIVNPAEWLEKTVYCHNKKSKQKEVLFSKAAYKGSIEDFLQSYESIHVPESIREYKIKVAEKIDSFIIDIGNFDDNEIRLHVLLGLATLFIQQRYDEKNESGFAAYRYDKKEFIKYLNTHIKTTSEKCISAYLISLVYENYVEIVEDNHMLSIEQISMLEIISKNTQVWFDNLTQTVDGQFRLLNTISFEKKEKLAQYKNLNINKRYAKIMEQKDNINSFLYYLWKIIMNLNIDLLDKSFDLNFECLKPEFYIETSINEYICMKFQGDTVDSSVIIPELTSGRSIKKRDDIYSRMFEVKPRKWYMSGSFRGNYEYTFNVADTGDGSSVLDVGKDSYRIECMECIGIDKGMWHEAEDCTKCIFTNKCFHRKDC